MPHIIVVSEDIYTRRRVRHVIPRHTAVLQFYLTGKQLIDRDGLEDSHCLILESRLRDFHGLRLFLVLKRDHPVVPPTILLGNRGQLSNQMAVEAFKAGISDCIEKPFTAGRLVRALRSTINAFPPVPS